MGDKTAIEWTDATFNPWWGCTKVSPACDNCYAERDAKRFASDQVLWGPGSTRREFGAAHWQRPLHWNAAAAAAGVRKRVFCASMADVFDKDAPQRLREDLWELIEATPFLDWQLLTKRVGNVMRMIPTRWIKDGFPSHAWLGISVVNQEEADRDVPKLLDLPVRVRFLSCEPILGAIDLVNLQEAIAPSTFVTYSALRPHGRKQWRDQTLAWVIVGGESGPRARPMHPDWVRGLRDQCVAAGVPFLFKQWGEWIPNDQRYTTLLAPWPATVTDHRWGGGVWSERVGKKCAGRELDGRTHDGMPS